MTNITPSPEAKVEAAASRGKTSLLGKLFRFLIVALAIVAGVAIILNFIANKEPPARLDTAQIAHNVRVIEAQLLPFTLQATGFGTAQPDQTWTAVANVKGNVVYRDENLENGEVLSKGTLLMQIDPARYELALLEANTEIVSIDAEITQLQLEAENTQALLDLERQRLALVETDLERTRELVARNTLPQARLDDQQRATLQQQQAVQSLVNQQNLVPVRLQRLEAQKDRALSRRSQVQKDLDDTNIYAPFDLRISQVNAELHQFVNLGQTLFSGDGIEASEIVLQVPMQILRRIRDEIPQSSAETEPGQLANLAELDAFVHLVADQDTRWPAQVVRIANGIDPATRTVQVVLKVTQPTTVSAASDQLPLPKGMYVQGVLNVPSLDPLLVVPQEAVHEGWVYIFDENKTLERRPVEVAYLQNGLAIISKGIEPGESIIIDDIVPAIGGMALRAERMLGVEADLAANAAGNTMGASL